MAPKYPLHNVLVVGGCGFLGHHIVDLLLQQHPNAKISVMDLRTEHNRRAGVTYFAGDITSRDDCRRAYRESGADVVINTVSPVTELGKEIYQKVNVEGTRILLETAGEVGVKVFVYTSSAGVVTDFITNLINVDESIALPRSYSDAYSESKAQGEKIVQDLNGVNGVSTCSLRVAGLFGPGDRQLIPGMLSVLHNKQTKFQLGGNENLFDFTYIENAAYAHILAAERLLHQIAHPPADPARAVAGQTFFITNGEPVYFWDFPRAVWALYAGYVAPYYIKMPESVGLALAGAAETYSKLVGKTPGFTRFRVRYACTHRYFNISKARLLLDYKVLYSVNDGLVKTMKHFKEQEAAAAQKKDQ